MARAATERAAREARGRAAEPVRLGGEGGEPTGTSCDLSGENKPAVLLDADIETDMTLDNSNDYLIVGIRRVRSGATLTIPACTRLEGTPLPNAGAIVVQRGGRLVADGERDAPILFTSPRPPGTRFPNQWGGIFLLGRAPITRADQMLEAKIPVLNDDADIYGSADDADIDDDSGVLRYVRIDYGGSEVAPPPIGLNPWPSPGLTLAGVGRGTVIDHVMVSNTLDDCFAWLGGTARANHLVANNCGDDYFDASEGWQGERGVLVRSPGELRVHDH